jgi:hypothetical protein
MKPLSLPLRLLVLASAIAGFAELAPEAAAVQDGSLTGGVGSGAGYRAFLDEYCVGCHNERTRTAGLTLDTADLDALSEDAELWERVVRKVKVGMMPPPGARRPPADQADSLVSWLERSLDAQAPSSPGYIALHRLNRAEYANAVGALLGVDVDASALLPEDDISDGFTNIANVLKVSPSFLDQYISAARYVASRAVGDPAPRVSTTTLGVPAGTDQSAYVEGMHWGRAGVCGSSICFPRTENTSSTLRSAWAGPTWSRATGL